MSKHHSLSMPRRLGLFTRPFRYAVTVPLLECLRLIARILPHGVGLQVGRWIGRVAALIDRKQWRLAGRQLKQAGIASDRGTLSALSTEIFIQLGMSAVESLHALQWTAEKLRAHLCAEGLEVFQSAMEGGGGLILVSAHMGNWELLGQTYNACTGKVPAAVMASQNNDLVTRWLIERRQAGGHTKLLPGNKTLAISRFLHGGGTLLMLADQDSTRSRGIFVDFFGRPAYTPAGPAYLARRIGVPMVPMAVVRDPQDPRRLRLLLAAEPLRSDPSLEEEADIQRLTQAYTRVFEGWIRQYPAQWVWIHNRWRHRPGQKIRVRSAERRD